MRRIRFGTLTHQAAYPQGNTQWPIAPHWVPRQALAALQAPVAL
ncbi:hypothetical protein N234_27500 [Ralstonia pickettii DTP0602]|nr:hypothetical protein N234_27500 [Ralstonia pickettii DTP0602]